MLDVDNYDPRALWRTLTPQMQEYLGALLVVAAISNMVADEADDDDPAEEHHLDIAGAAQLAIEEMIALHFGSYVDAQQEPDKVSVVALSAIEHLANGGRLS